MKKPGSKAYSIAYSISSPPLVFGVSRMYEIQSADEYMDVIVLNSINELPEEIRTKIPV